MTIHRGFSETDLSTLSGIPVAKFDAADLPDPPEPGFLSDPAQARNNARYIADTLAMRCGAGQLSPSLLRHKLKLLSELGENVLLPYSSFVPEKSGRGKTVQPASAVLVSLPSTISPHRLFSLLADLPHGLIERAEHRLADGLFFMTELREASRLLLARRGTAAPDTHRDLFRLELKSVVMAHAAAPGCGLTTDILEADRSLRTLAAFNSSDKSQWFSPQINGIEASYAETVAAHRELRLTTIFTTAGRRKLPPAEEIRAWASLHDGEHLQQPDKAQRNLMRRIDGAIDHIQSTLSPEDSYRADLFSLAWLQQDHEFAQPLARQLADLTVAAARRFMPRLLENGPEIKPGAPPSAS